jgi:hypothetical protein
MDIESLLAKGRSKTAKPPQKLKKQQATSAGDLANSALADSANDISDKLESLPLVNHDAAVESEARESAVTPRTDPEASSFSDSNTISTQENIVSATVSEPGLETCEVISADAKSANAETSISDLANASSAKSEFDLAEAAIANSANSELAIAEAANAVIAVDEIGFADSAIAKTAKAKMDIAESDFASTAIAETAKAETENAKIGKAEAENAIKAKAETDNAQLAKANSENAGTAIAVSAIPDASKSDQAKTELAISDSMFAETANAQKAIAKTANANIAKAESVSVESPIVEQAKEVTLVKKGAHSTSENTLIQSLLTDSNEAEREFVSRVVSYLASSEFGLREIRIALYLLGRTIREGRGWLLYSNQEIEQGTNCHFTHVSTSMTSLEKYGFIERTHPKRTAEKKSFRIVWP